ncbi:hypothetical protein CFP56_025929 [Quercus suber]|uniref:Uncharacterized protein n=1 Tax=Quercus suber TaxID=58331 RepID=A0AAW0LZB3_QUESU
MFLIIPERRLEKKSSTPCYKKYKHQDDAIKNAYGASRGVYGTPFFLNGFYLPDAGSTTNFTGWRSLIDPLIGEKGQQE